ncbi:MAG TPA: R3H domain-containing nucleic acid-binding protein [Actinomycetota bacterium]|nr:R3H domain-containing nucleic acid-binding protein [Actinomycetota bacterium]
MTSTDDTGIDEVSATGKVATPPDGASVAPPKVGEGDPAEQAGAQAPGAGEPGDEAQESEEDRLAMAQEDALDFIDGLLEAMDVDGEATAEIRDRRVYVSVQGEEAAILIGHHGQTLDAIQELLRSAVQRQVRARVWVTLDVQGYRERRKEALRERAKEMAARAIDEGEMELEPMNAFERKIVHDAVGEIEGVTSFSEGEEPYRRVVIAPED